MALRAIKSSILTLGLMVSVAVPAASNNSDHADCKALPGITPICGMQAPEDLELGPWGKTLVMSEFGGFGRDAAGGLAVFDLASEQVRQVYPAGVSADKSWGADNCPGELGSRLSPHGIHLSKRANGDWQVLLVNHGQRESIEFFQLYGNEQEGVTGLSWRGCVVMPAGAFANDVVGLADGSFISTQMMTKGDKQSQLAAHTGKDSGHLWYWQPDAEVSILADKKLPFPNGIQISADRQFLFINMYSLGEVRKLDRRTGELVASAKYPARITVPGHRTGV